MRSKVVKYDSISSLSDSRVSLIGSLSFLESLSGLSFSNCSKSSLHLDMSCARCSVFFLVTAVFFCAVLHHTAHNIDEACDVVAG